MDVRMASYIIDCVESAMLCLLVYCAINPLTIFLER